MTSIYRGDPVPIEPADLRSLSCRELDDILQAGPRHLKEETFDLLTEHIGHCAACSQKFDEFDPDDAESSDANSPEPTEPVDLDAALIQQVLDQLTELPRKAVAPTALYARSPGADRSLGQLAPRRKLRGHAYDFIVSEPIGSDDFTETYLAQRYPVNTTGEIDQVEPAVIKIPRVADGMSRDAAIARLAQLNTVIQLSVQTLRNLAGLRSVAGIVDCGNYTHWLHGQQTTSTFVAYEFVNGLRLSEYMARYHSQGGRFCGLSSARDFAQWARMLATGVLEIHNRLALHGDICPRNILVKAEGQPVFIDVGQSLFREVMNGANAFGGNFYRAPEGIGSPSSDLFSLGGVLYFLATGKDPIGFNHSERDSLKQAIMFSVKEANPQLHQDDAGVADIIAVCLRKDQRVQHASQLLQDIDAFWPELSAPSILDEVKSLTDVATVMDTESNSVFQSSARSQIRSLHRVLDEMTKGVFDANGSGREIRKLAYALLRPLGSGDQFLTVSLPVFWHPNNIGINGKFLSMCRNAAVRGASIKRVFLIDERLSDPHLQQIVEAHLTAAADLDSNLRQNFTIRYLPVSEDKRRKYIAEGKHFGLLIKDDNCIAMFPVYDDDVLVTLRFRSGHQQIDGLKETFEALWTEANPLVDLSLPTSSLNLDVIRHIG